MLKHNLSLKTGYAWALLAVGLLLTVFISHHVKQNIEREAVKQFAFTCDQVTLKIQEHLATNALILKGGAALFSASKAVNRHEWRAYVETLRANGSLPGIQGIGFAQVIPADRLAKHIARIRSEGFPQYTLHPPGQRAIYTAVIYLEPFRDANLRAFGYDMFSEQVRRVAMEQAGDTGEAALSGKVQLVQETGTEVQARTLMYAPVYRNDAPVNTIVLRRAALIGWVYSPFRMNDLITGILGDWEHYEGRNIDLHIYDSGEATPANLLFDSKSAASSTLHSLFYQQRTINFNNKPWLLVFVHAATATDINYTLAWVVLISGFTLSSLLFVLMVTVINTRANAFRIADGLIEEIRHNEDLLRQSETSFKLMVEASPLATILLDKVNHTTLHINHKFTELFGYSADELPTVAEWWPKAYPDEEYRRWVMNEWLCKTKVTTRNNTFSQPFESRVVCKNSSIKLIDWSFCSVGDKFVSFGLDITERNKVAQELRISEERLNIITSSAQDAIIMLDEAGNIAFWNRASEKIFGYVREEVLGHNLHEMLTPVSFMEAHNRTFPHFQKTGQGAAIGKTIELTGLRKDGSEFPMELSLSAARVQNLWHAIGIVRDISERKIAEEKLHLAASVFAHAWEGIMITTPDGTIIDVNDAFSRITSYTREEVLGQNSRLLSSSSQSRDFYSIMWDSLVENGQWSGEVWNRRKDGEVYAVLQTIGVVRDNQGEPRHYVAMFSDITVLKEHESELEHIAHYDTLTKLPNRVLLADRMRQGITQIKRHGHRLAVGFLDLDGFKAINDDYGHDAGDQILIAAAERMKKVLREGDTLARVGGDEFVVLLLDLADDIDIEPLLTRLLAAAAQPMQLGNISLKVSASIGLTFYPQGEDIDADQLLRQADQAMYQAKLAGKNRYHFFDAEQAFSIRNRYESLGRIREAMTAGEFVLYYQPKVDMRTGRVIGAEALIRWQHPEKGLLLPAVFLPVIEDHSLAVDIGRWVIDTALTQIELWQASGLNIPVSVNVGPRQLQHPDFVESLREMLSAHPNVRPGDLELEVLETSAMEDLTKVSRVIDASRNIGVNFSLDDFGTGYSSLTYLKRLPVTLIKIDQSFVRDLLDDPDDRAILEGVLGLATAFRLQVIAEGVETVEHGTLLLQLGCDLAQGYGIARPMPAHHLPAWSATWQPDPAWTELPCFSREDLPLLFASIEHRAWIKVMEKYLKGECDAPMSLDIHQCRFGQWLDTEGLARYGTQPYFAAIEQIHRQMHELATGLCELNVRDRNPEALAKLGTFHELRDSLLEQLKALIHEIR